MKKRNCQNFMSIKILSKEANLGTACLAVVNFAKQLKFSGEELYDIETCVSEAVQNCILHAYKNKEGYISVMVRILDDTTVDIVVKDEGTGIADVEGAMKPFYTTGGEDSNCSGLGFTIMETFMTKCNVEAVLGEGTTVHMQKCIGQL